RLVLRDDVDAIIPEGLEGTTPYVRFFGSGVQKVFDETVDLNNDRYYFSSNGLPLGNHTVNYNFYQDYGFPGNLACLTTGTADFNVFDANSLIGNLDIEYREYDSLTAVLVPTLEANETLLRMFLKVKGSTTEIPAGGGYGLNETSPGSLQYYFDPTEASTKVDIANNQTSIVVEIFYEFTNPFLIEPQNRSQVTEVFLRPEIDFDVQGDISVGFEVKNAQDGIFKSCDYTGLITLAPNHNISQLPGTEFFFTSNYDSINGTTTVFKDATGIWKFDPAQIVINDLVKPENITIYYTYKEGTPASDGALTVDNTRSKTIKVYAQPPTPTVLTPVSTGDIVCVIDKVDPAEITNRVSGPDEVGTTQTADVGWYDNVNLSGDPLETKPVFLPAFADLTNGVNTYFLSQTINSCISDATPVIFEKLSSFDFTLNTQILNGGPVEFRGDTTGIKNPKGAYWTIKDDKGKILNDNTINTGLNFNFALPDPGVYNVALMLISENDCPAEKPRDFIFVEKRELTGTVLEDFSSTGGWVSVASDGTSGTTWEHGQPTGFSDYKAENGNIWMTKLNKKSFPAYPAQDDAYLYSPAYNFTAMDKPMMTLDLYFQSQLSDGLVLQYTTDTLLNANTKWEAIGTNNEGVNWYTATGISSVPGGQEFNQFGWNGESGEWLLAKAVLDSVAGKQNVIFRFAFASADILKNALNGFAIDNLFIGNRTRKVLVEHFTNQGSAETNTQNTKLSDFMDDIAGNNAVLVNYRTGFPDQSDPVYLENTSQTGARAIYYGINQVPRVRMDGQEALADGLWTQWGKATFGTRTLDLADMTIDIGINTSNGIIEISPVLHAINDLPGEALAHIVVVENEITTDEVALSPEQSIRYVMKKMLPTAAGTRFPSGFIAGETAVMDTYTWAPYKLTRNTV
ncbi:MAG: hypothetical protein OEX02_18935, partial [Cyclobacteriaceae bacterium]|nr:hypothetical protein [Cyclobacteriaceae bacterium]